MHPTMYILDVIINFCPIITDIGQVLPNAMYMNGKDS